jgi:hypothetical protein
LKREDPEYYELPVGKSKRIKPLLSEIKFNSFTKQTLTVKQGLNYPTKLLYVELGKDDGKPCLLNDCTRELGKDGKPKSKRKMIICGYETVHVVKPQLIKTVVKQNAMYFSSGKNAYNSLQPYFSKIDIDENQCRLWLPASGLGYEKRTKEYCGVKERGCYLKILKGMSINQPSQYKFYGHYDLISNRFAKEYSFVTMNRFINLSLLQLSYILGGQFWKTYGEEIMYNYPELNLQSCVQYDIMPYVLRYNECFVRDNQFNCALKTNDIIGTSLTSRQPIDLRIYSSSNILPEERDMLYAYYSMKTDRGVSSKRKRKQSNKKKKSRKRINKKSKKRSNSKKRSKSKARRRSNKRRSRRRK